MGFQHIIQDQHGLCRVLTISNPGRKNAFHPDMRDELNAALDLGFADPGVRSFILTGANGDFCSGADLARLAAADPSAAAVEERLQSMHGLVRRITGGPKPIIAAVEGVAAGAGLSLAIAADIVIAGRGARFIAAFARVGLFPDMGVLHTLPSRVGLSLARRILMEGREISAGEAVAIGLADGLAGAEGALGAALEAAAGFDHSAPLTLSAVKSALADGYSGINVVLDMERREVPRLSASFDHRAARAAFLSKTTVEFQGR